MVIFSRKHTLKRSLVYELCSCIALLGYQRLRSVARVVLKGFDSVLLAVGRVLPNWSSFEPAN